MIILNTINDIRLEIKEVLRDGKSIGFVPTMGYLHEGHLSLVKRAKQENDIVVVSIFVNPTQFGPGEDFESYPRDLERDSKLVKDAGADIVFAPQVNEMYPEGCSTYVEVEGNITKKLCGASRPGHFKGVTTIVSKLFNIVTPHRAYFGQKDAQQVAVIEKMVRDLCLDIEIVPCPIIREDDGLAMSSRNIYLNEEERRAATILSDSLFKVQEMIRHGEKQASRISDFIISNIKNEELAEIDYVEIVSAKTLEEIEEIKGDVLIALAVKIGKARLIDNIRLEV
ncbi:pantoate--beta-alanine ligase [Paramaledivibacter caminithermalis DSM 15212]|uniref:Pantothenate synthetase n=1 Tax=Paramaledivibacter caminithermalis (strain DSM 15212 / CIP 107654 / DViRD3) TaxID=1121301 RepID=A0A1M6SLK2_PARC5|nr:pantoate--beta-alanine ligase [Paramaledivibacter caminithermalis]SHK45516.1 pantoate--beta-alanine ligase [Paramaledivibacter caminithermalis DSM 15212]